MLTSGWKQPLPPLGAPVKGGEQCPALQVGPDFLDKLGLPPSQGVKSLRALPSHPEGTQRQGNEAVRAGPPLCPALPGRAQGSQEAQLGRELLPTRPASFGEAEPWVGTWAQGPQIMVILVSALLS